MKKLLLPFVFLVSGFIGLGDRVLPAPLNGMSLSARTTLNQMVMGLVPTLKPQRPDSGTEKAVDALNHSH